jgi:signal transduction histidine kinase
MLVIADATERVRVQRELESRVEARTRELSTLLDVSHKVASTLKEITSYLDPETVLQLIADEARRLTSSKRGLVFLPEGDHLRVSVVSGESAPDILGYRMPVENSVTGQVFKSGQPAIIDDAQRDPRVHGQLAQRAGVESLLIVPLMSGSGPIGAISLADKTSGSFGPDDERMLTTLASGAAVALENARLYEAEQERRQVAETLRGALSILNSDRPLAEILDYIVAEAVRLLGAAAGAIYRLQADQDLLVVQAVCGLPDTYPVDSSLPAGEGPVGRAVLDGRPVTLSDLPQAQSLELPGGPCQALLAVPVVVKGEVYGALALYLLEPRGFSDEEVGLAATFGDQAALAIENAWLRQQARQAGMLEERERLARELHDSVTQSLYSLTMFAAAGSELAVSGDWETVTHQLGRIGETAQQALKEMRLMVHQLRPLALEDEGLAGALRQRLEAVEGRSGVEARLIMDELLELPAEVEEGLYRITQEALNNSLKHAAAVSVTVYLRSGAGRLDLEVVDDGRGFSPGTIAGRGGMGLNSMQERARLMGGSLTVTSAPGEGTRVRVSLADPTLSPAKE